MGIMIALPEDETGYNPLDASITFLLRPSLHSSTDELKKRIPRFLNRDWMSSMKLVTTEWCCSDRTCEWTHGWSDGQFCPAKLRQEGEEETLTCLAY